MDIRILAPGDEALLIQAVELSDEGPLSFERAAEHLAEPDLVNVVAVEDGAAVGFLYGYVLRRFEAISFFIYSVDTEEAHRRRGCARAMIEAVNDLGKSGRWDEMFVLTNAGNEAAMALYASAGGVRPLPADVVMFDFKS
jgi:ribosomal protein S18 acetylase RimI-like enzyme